MRSITPHLWFDRGAVEAAEFSWSRLEDRYGLSWQVVPSSVDEMLPTGTEQQTARVTAAFLQMRKFDITRLERAYRGSDVPIGGGT